VEAEADLTSALKLEPKNAGALNLRARERMDYLKDYAGALEDLNAYLTLEPEDATAVARRGVARTFLRDFHGALEDFDLAQDLRPSDQTVFGPKAFAQEMLDDHEGALESGKKGVKANPSDFSANYALARSAMELGRCAEGAVAIDWLVKKDPTSSDYLWIRGDCRSQAGDFTNGLADLRKSVEIEPTSSLYSTSLAHQERRFLDSDPKSATLEEFKKAVLYFDHARGLTPLETSDRIDRARTLFDLGTLSPSDRAGLWKDASAECDAVLKKNPADRGAKALHQRIRAALKPAKKPAAL
jgi:serine/threonine-protein kinase